MSNCNSGVYMIRHRRTGHSYIGASANLKQRLWEHRAKILNRSRRVHWDAFAGATEADIEMRVLEFIELDPSKPARLRSQPHLQEREIFWIRKLRPSLNVRHGRPEIDPATLPVGAPAA